MRRLAIALSLVAAMPVAAQSLDERLREQLRATTTQLRDAQSALATAEAAKATAEKQRDALKAKSGGADSNALAAARTEAAASATRANAVDAGLANAYAQIATLRTQLDTARQDLGRQRTLAVRGTADAASVRKSLDLCMASNDGLVTTANEVLAVHIKRFGNGNFPPMQLARTNFEAQAQAYGDRIAAARLAPAKAAPVQPDPAKPVPSLATATNPQ